MTYELDGVAIVTGAGGGLGRQCVLAFAAEGCSAVAGFDISAETLTETEAALKTEYPHVDFLPVTTDLSKESDIEAAFKQTVDRYGRIDYLVNNAGAGIGLKRADEFTTADYDLSHTINSKAVFLCQKYALRQMMRQEKKALKSVRTSTLRGDRRGAIVHVASAIGLVGMKHHSAYCAGKAAAIALAKCAGIDFAKEGIRVNAVCPGWIDTPMVPLEAREALKPNINIAAMERMADPAEIADAVVFLCSDRASFITGQAIPVDGGYTTV
ncbi:hypothetical protein FB567DRAFT_610539 [Paraphoma chrysanthemicola]|uniref:Uncharacterized protein n=1 Tax=Paraphoma chrysanthemicola TaxID=798071 RepID=A0A8K0QX33_9PLEO|nr:hypothetical protein FB567DRAFT_610539 [Paraphoma chrysanthemicola]